MKTASEKTRITARKSPQSAGRAGANRSKSGLAPITLAAAPARIPQLPQWTFLTNHAHVLVLLSRNPSMVLREVALQVGITERAVQRIIADLEAGGVIEREKVGRQNHYRIRIDQPLRHPIESHRTIGEFLAPLINADG